MSNTLIIILAIILAWWSGLLPALLLLIGSGIAVVAIGIVRGVESVWHANWFGPTRWFLLNVTGAENRKIRKVMAAQMRMRPRMSVAELHRYETALRESRKRNIRREN